MTEASPILPGDLVTASHRGTHTGFVLDRHDPRAWTNTLAFPRREPTAEEVRTHLEDCARRGLTLRKRVPIRWCFGVTDWERTETLQTVQGTCLCNPITPLP
jgi:hypothetical protein